MCRKTSLPPSSPTTKPKPLSLLNHLTVPSTVVAVDGSWRSRPDDARDEERIGRRSGAAVLASTARTAVICRPFWPTPTCTLSFAPGSTESRPAASKTAACRNASPEPSASSTKPNPFSGLNHLTIASSAGPLGAASSRGALRKEAGRGGPDRPRVGHHRSRAGSSPVSSSSHRFVRLVLTTDAPNDANWLFCLDALIQQNTTSRLGLLHPSRAREHWGTGIRPGLIIPYSYSRQHPEASPKCAGGFPASGGENPSAPMGGLATCRVGHCRGPWIGTKGSPTSRKRFFGAGGD